MAQKVQTFLIDDLDGSEAEGTVFFGLGGAQYEIDLSTDHAKELRTTWLAISTLEGGSPVPPGGQVRTGARLPRAASATLHVHGRNHAAWMSKTAAGSQLTSRPVAGSHWRLIRHRWPGPSVGHERPDP